MITIAKFENFFEAELASSLLLENGIATELLNVRMLSMAPGLAGQRLQIELQVPASQKEMALLILNIQDTINPAEELLRAEGAILEGHFQLTSGRHSGMYVEKIRLLQNPSAAKELCAQLATLLADYDIDCVVGPAYGGIALAFEVASLLGKSFVFCQRKDGQMTIRSGFDLNGVKRVAIVEDIVTTGGSVEEVMACLSQRSIAVEVVAALVDRSGGKADFGVPFLNLLQLDIPSWEPDQCPLCAQGLPLVKPGSSDKAPAPDTTP